MPPSVLPAPPKETPKPRDASPKATPGADAPGVASVLAAWIARMEAAQLERTPETEKP